MTDCLREGRGVSQFWNRGSSSPEEEDEEEDDDDDERDDAEDDEELEEVRDTLGEWWRGRSCDFTFTTEVDWRK